MADTISKWKWDAKAVAIVMVWALTAPVAVTFGDPPPWLLAQAARPKSAPLYLGYTGKKWDRDYGVSEGHCDHQLVITGPTRASPVRAGKPEVRHVATVTGPMMGAEVGMLDERDLACIGHTLELGGVERRVAWTNTGNGMKYRVMPLGGFTDMGKSCREFVTRLTVGGRDKSVRHKACSAGDGIWQVVG